MSINIKEQIKKLYAVNKEIEAISLEGEMDEIAVKCCEKIKLIIDEADYTDVVSETIIKIELEPNTKASHYQLIQIYDNFIGNPRFKESKLEFLLDRISSLLKADIDILKEFDMDDNATYFLKVDCSHW